MAEKDKESSVVAFGVRVPRDLNDKLETTMKNKKWSKNTVVNSILELFYKKNNEKDLVWLKKKECF